MEIHRESIYSYGKPDSRLTRFIVVSERLRDKDNVIVDAYQSNNSLMEHASTVVCDCESIESAERLVAELHRTIVNRVMRKDTEKRKRKIMVDLLTFALYCRSHLRFVMMQDEFHRAMFEEMESIVDEAKKIVSDELSMIHHENLIRQKETITSQKGGGHAQQNQKRVLMGNSEPSAPGTADHGADTIQGDRDRDGDSLL